MAMMQHQHMGQHSSMRRVAPAPTGPDTRATSEQYPEVDFLTLVGSLHALEIVIEQWAPLVGAANFQSTTLPRILALPSATQEYASQALRVAVVRHEANLGPTLVTRLRTQLNLFQIADVVVEEGYFLSSAGPPSGNHDQLDMVDSWSVRWETRHLDALCRRFEVPLVPDLLGAAFTGRWEFPRKAVLIDTGDEGAATQTGFDIELTAVERPSDHHGHGTSVGSLMRMTAPQAEVHSYRVMRHGDNFVESSVLLNAITSATMMIGEYHIVVIPQRANLSVQKRGQ